MCARKSFFFKNIIQWVSKLEHTMFDKFIYFEPMREHPFYIIIIVCSITHVHYNSKLKIHQSSWFMFFITKLLLCVDNLLVCTEIDVMVCGRRCA